MTFTFNEFCKLLTGYPADNMPLPERKADWDYVARQLIYNAAKPRLNYSQSKFQRTYRDEQTLDNLFCYLTNCEVSEEVLDSEDVWHKKSQGDLYLRLAKACAKCYILEEIRVGHTDRDISPTAWLKEKNVVTFEQFCFRHDWSGVSCQIED